MKRLRSLWHWLCLRFRDLFFATGNEHLDLARCMAGLCTGFAAFALFWNAVHLGQPIDLPGFLTGLAALYTATLAGIAAKEWVKAQAKKDGG